MDIGGAESAKIVEEGLKAWEADDTAAALERFEKVGETDRDPVVLSCLGYSLAKERGEYREGISLCTQAIKDDPRNSIHFLNLGRVYVLAGNKKDALRIFRKGMGIEQTQQLRKELSSHGLRKPPVIPFFKRSNPLNRYLGKLLTRLGLR